MADVQRYVNTASSGGNGTTNGTSGATAAYASLNAWDAAEETDLTSVGDIHYVDCDAGSGGADTTAITMGGWTTDAGDYVVIRANASESQEASITGWNTGIYRLSVAASPMELANTHHVRVQNLQIETTASWVATISCWADAGGGSTDTRIDSCYLRCTANNSDGVSVGNVNTVIRVFNCVITGNGHANSTGVLMSAAATMHVANCVIYDWGDGADEASGTINIHNTALFKNSDDLVNAPTTVDYCAYDDADTTTNEVTESGGGTEWPSDFADAANGDFTLQSGSNLVDAGATDPLSGYYSDDMEGTTRSSWDVGAHEYVSAGGATEQQTKFLDTEHGFLGFTPAGIGGVFQGKEQAA